MTPFGTAEVVGWRLDVQVYAPTWDSGVGASMSGGRWNSAGVRAVYCSLDPSTAILEVAVHKRFAALDTVPHVLTWFRVDDPNEVHLVAEDGVPNPRWLQPGTPSGGQQTFGDGLLASHRFVALPSSVSSHSWNIIFDPARAAGAYTLLKQERFALDTRLNPPS